MAHLSYQKTLAYVTGHKRWPRGLPRRASAYEISKSSGFHGFQSGFLDFKVDSGFQADFWISKRISGFHLNRYYSEDTAKIYS